MLKLLVKKGMEAALTLLLATLIIFVLTRLAPGDPIALLLSQQTEVAASDTTVYERKAEELRVQWGLDQSLPVQYAEWLKRLVGLDLGQSIHTGRPVGSELAERLPATIQLSFAALAIQIALGLLIGALSALWAGKASDGLIRFLCVALASTPAFVIGLALLSLFAVTWNVYEISSEDDIARLWLPAVTLGLIGAPPLIRVVRANMLAELGQTYILAALARGLGRRQVVGHALRNALLPVVTMAGLSLTALISGAVVIESVFSWPGIGKYALDSILLKDYPVIQGYAFVMVAFIVLIHLLVDVVYMLVDPRLRRTRKKGAEAYA
ncbi:ABC transporter permease [Paenibacillus sp. YYML68]|uniref:ABC transporter permease n=1 Tax=Paenibacillus sp. YYML68 TaxID=2909250 RepID=UPI0024901F37|nr:ABC transporter permease [Paenibacillus sp. YYML68]